MAFCSIEFVVDALRSSTSWTALAPAACSCVTHPDLPARTWLDTFTWAGPSRLPRHAGALRESRRWASRGRPLTAARTPAPRARRRQAYTAAEDAAILAFVAENGPPSERMWVEMGALKVIIANARYTARGSATEPRPRGLGALALEHCIAQTRDTRR